MSDFVVKDSGERQQFDSGMMRDTSVGKTEWHRVFEGPLLERWAEHLTKGAAKYPDIPDGSANWTLASGQAELARFRASAARHFAQWMRGDTDEDHAAAVVFNINGAEHCKAKMAGAIEQTAVRERKAQHIDAYMEKVARTCENVAPH